ncbi:hypothetical protein GFH48_35215 [Streptomyces fagopyri]|uniref:Pentapeptide repeat-containing protein n=1 Tax=Streptomyces fagopyri TaxID=2662397 RepID=A0A5Q0LLB2_9ACTN|nr:hypothetical protein GFH48_35215 [Streptomyces fagopyri]
MTAYLRRPARLDAARFDDVVFPAAVFLAGAVFFAAVFFAGAVFLAGADFFAAVFFAGAVFLAGADFFAAVFFAGAVFGGAGFRGADLADRPFSARLGVAFLGGVGAEALRDRGELRRCR